MDNNFSENLIEIPFNPSTIENIDTAVFRFLDETFNISVKSNTSFRKVPVQWVSPERAFLSKDKPRKEGIFELPVITIQRTGINKDLANRGSIWANVPPVDDVQGGSITIAKRLMQSKTKEFANALSKRTYNQENFKFDNPKRVFQFISIPQVVYIDTSYLITLKSNYQTQMNTMITPFITRPGAINYRVIENFSHRYELFIDGSLSQTDNVANLGNEERLFTTEIKFDVLGYLFGDEKNGTQPTLKIRESIVEYRFPRETVIFPSDGLNTPQQFSKKADLDC
jgi:hypothetical protein